MSAEKKKPDEQPTPEEILDALSPPARRCVRVMCKTPDAAVAWYNRLADVRAALKVGVEVMETSAREEAKKVGHPTSNSNFKMQAAMYALGTVTALECCMAVVERLAGDAIKVNETDPTAPKHLNGDGEDGNRIRKIVTD